MRNNYNAWLVLWGKHRIGREVNINTIFDRDFDEIHGS